MCMMYVMYSFHVPEPLSVTAFRAGIGPRLSDVIRGRRPAVVRRGARELAVVIGADEADLLLADRAFTPRVYGGEQGVSVWLPELELLGEGDDLAAARADLLGEVRAYIDCYLEDDGFAAAPNRRGHLAHVLRAHLADLDGRLDDVVFPAAPVAA